MKPYLWSYHEKIVIVTGGFDPLHKGHISYLGAARELGDELWVGVNSDKWLARKKGQPFMQFEDRVAIIEALDCVDKTIAFDDSDGSAINAIALALDNTDPDLTQTIIFANGGDRTISNIPEMDAFVDNPKVKFVFGVGGEDKQNSSSWILTEWKTPKTKRVWGYYRNLHSDGPGVKVKELTVNPNSKLSMQMHDHRSEHWHVTHGIATVNTSTGEPDTPVWRRNYKTQKLTKDETINIPVSTWHQLCNNTDDELRVVEIQHGENCIEEDIIRHGVDPYYGK